MSWESKELGHLCDFVRGPFGGNLKKSCFKQDGYAVYEQQHAIYGKFSTVRYFIDENKFRQMMRFELAPGDIIMSCSGTMGKAAIVPEYAKKGIINQALLRISPNQKRIDATFLKLWMESTIFQTQVNQHSKGVAIKNVASVKTLKKIRISLPPLKEQQQIVKILDQAFSLLDELKANTEKQLANAKELFESYLSRVFSRMVNDCEKRKLAQVTKLIGGGTPPKSNQSFYSGQIPWATIRDMKEDFLASTQYRITQQAVENSSTNVIPKGNIVIGTRVGLGKVCILLQDTAINQDIKAIIPTTSHLGILYLYWHLRSLRKEIINAGTGATVQGIKTNYVRNIQVSIPPIKEQQQIVSILDKLSLQTKQLTEHYQHK